ncbi:MAG: 1-deoxy-D-xylulose-5-phosphate synthase, partial [bacterium]|nr:1-deoxy-D-xylulose-5-phosphate synthase [bacterium]
MTGGMAFEGLNNLGHSGRDVVIVLNDNGRSYAPTVSRLGESLIKIRNNPTYMRRQAKIEEIAERIPWVGEQIGRGVKMSKAAIREMWEPPACFENLGIRYTGPFDGHDIESVEEALENAAGFDGPVLVHVLTQKGRGYAPAEQDLVKAMHDTGTVKEGSYTAAFSEAMVKLGDQHPELVAITAAMPDSTGLLPFKERFPDRCIDVGIAEQHAITAATGMAMGGLRPLIAVYATFLT